MKAMLAALLLATPISCPINEDKIPLCTPPTPCEEADLFSQLTENSRRLYESLDCEGKRRAVELSHEYCNPACAVDIAAEEMQKRQALHPKYPLQEVDEEAGQDQFNGSYGY